VSVLFLRLKFVLQMFLYKKSKKNKKQVGFEGSRFPGMVGKFCSRAAENKKSTRQRSE